MERGSGRTADISNRFVAVLSTEREGRRGVAMFCRKKQYLWRLRNSTLCAVLSSTSSLLQTRYLA